MFNFVKSLTGQKTPKSKTYRGVSKKFDSDKKIREWEAAGYIVTSKTLPNDNIVVSRKPPKRK